MCVVICRVDYCAYKCYNVFVEDNERKYIAKLIRRIASGDEDALTELYHTVGGRMLSVAISYVGDRASAEDVLQDSFLAVVKNADKFRFYQNGYGWLCTIVRNTALNYIKARNRRRADNIDDMYYLASSEELEARAVDTVTVESALARLEKEQRAVLYYKYYEDLTVRQIAERMNISKSSADRLIARSEQSLRELLKD